MYNTTDSYKSKIYNVNHFLKVYINDAEIESKYILDCRPSSTLFTNGEIELGSTPSQTVELQLYKTAVPDSITKIEIKSGITGEIVPIGVYNVDKISKVNDYTVSLTLSDNMIKFEFNYDGSKLVNDNNGKVKIIQVLQDICSKAGVELGSTSFLNMNKEIAVYDNTVSARTYLSYISEQAGGFAFIGRDGKLYIKSFKYALGKKIGEGKSIVIEKTNNLKAKTVIKGEHSQKKTQGINLCDLNVTQNNRVTYNSDGTITINGTGGFTLAFKRFTAKANTKYYIKWELVSGTVDTSKSNGNSFLNPLDATNIKQGEFKESIVENDKDISGFWVNNMAVFTNAVIKIWFSETQSDFEPYTGGKPSPSPDYPQEIETVGDNINYFDKDNLSNVFINGNTGFTQTSRAWRLTDYIVPLYKTYNFSWDSDSSFYQVTILFYNKDKTFLHGIIFTLGNVYSKSFDVPDGVSYMRINYSVNVNNVDVTRENIKLEKGNARTAYSNYNQGSVEVIKQNKNFIKLYDNDTLTLGGLTYTLNKDTGEILINGTSLYNTWVECGYAFKGGTDPQTKILKKLKENETYTLSCRKKSGTVDKAVSFFVQITEDNKTIATSIGNSAIRSDCTGIYRFWVYVPSGTTCTNLVIQPQLEQGSTATNFVEHQEEEEYIIPVQQEMLEGDYIDSTEHHEWSKLILTGDETIFRYSTNTSDVYRFAIQNIDIPNQESTVKSLVFCNILENVTALQTYLRTEGISGYKFQIIAYIKECETMTIEEFKTWLKSKYDEGNPVIIYYKLATPIELELTDEQKKVLKEIHNMDLYEDYTIIESDAEMQVNFARAEIPIRYFQSFEWGAKYKLSKIRYEDGIRVFEKGDETGNALYINPDNMFIVDQDQINNIYDELKDLELYSFKGDSIIDPAIDIGDILVIDGKQVLYQGSSQYSGRWKASISSEIKSKERQETTTVKKPSQKTINRRVQSSIDQVNGKIEQLIEENTETSEKLTKHEQDINSIKDIVESIEDFTREVSSYQELHLTDTADYAENLVLTLTIYGNTEKWKELEPSTSLAPSTLLAPLGTTIDLIVDSQSRLNPSKDKQVFTINYGKKLRSLGNVRDELDIINNKVTIIRRIGLNDSGQEYVLQTEQTEELGELKLPTLKDNTYIYVREYPNLEYFCRYITDNEYIKKFATQEGLKEATVNLNTKIEQSNKEIILLARQKVGKDEIIASINLTPEKAKILAKLIELEGIVTANQNFKILLDGSMEATNGKFTGGKIQLENGSSSNPTFLIGTGSTQSFLTNEGFYANSDTAGKAYIFVDGNEGAISILGNSGQTFIRPNKVSTTGEMWATAYNYQSQAKLKENIVKFKREALYMIKNSDIYEFNY